MTNKYFKKGILRKEYWELFYPLRSFYKKSSTDYGVEEKLSVFIWGYLVQHDGDRPC